MNQCIKVVAVTWSLLAAAVCSPLPQIVETIPSITSTIDVSSTVDPDTIQLTTAFPQLPGQTVAIFRDVREVTLKSNNSSVSHEDSEHGTALPSTASEENSSEDDKSRSQRNLAETKGAGQNETQSTTEHSEEVEPEVKKSPITSHDHNSDIYGKTTAEELADLSVLDVLLRKRRAFPNSHHKQKRTLPETAGSDEVLLEEAEDSNEDVSEEIHTNGGSEPLKVARIDGNLSREVEVTEPAHTLNNENKNGTHVISYSNSNNAKNGTQILNEPANEKSDVNNAKKSTSSIDSAHQGDENANKPTVLIITVFRQHEADKGTTPSVKFPVFAVPNATGRQADGNAKPSEISSESVVPNTPYQQTENESDPLEKRASESKHESDTDNVQKSEKIDTTNENEKPLDTINGQSYSNVSPRHKEDKHGTSLKRSTESKQENETDLISSTDSPTTTKEDKKHVDEANRHLFTNVTRFTKVEKNVPLLKSSDESTEETKIDPSPQEHESHVADEGVKLLDETTHSLFSNVSGHEHEKNSENLNQGNEALNISKSLFSNVTAHEPHSLEITEGTARVTTNINATHSQDVSGRKLDLEITEGTSQVSTNHEILHAVQRRSDVRIEVSNPTVVPNPNLASNLHLSTNPYDDDRPHDVISIHKESYSSENRLKDKVCSDESHCNVKRSDDEYEDSGSSEDSDNRHVTSQVPSVPLSSKVHDKSHFNVEPHVSSNLSTLDPLQSQTQTTSNGREETESETDKNHQVEKRSRDDAPTGHISEAGNSASSVQAVNVLWAENHTKEASSTHETPTTYETSTAREATSPKSRDYSQNPSTVISKSLHNEHSSEGIDLSSVTESPQTASCETSSQNRDQTGNCSNDENEDDKNTGIKTHVISTKEGSQDIQRNKDALQGNTDEQKTSTTVGSVSTERFEESTTVGADKQVVLSSTTLRQETSTAEKSEGVLDGFKSIARFIGF